MIMYDVVPMCFTCAAACASFIFIVVEYLLSNGIIWEFCRLINHPIKQVIVHLQM